MLFLTLFFLFFLRSMVSTSLSPTPLQLHLAPPKLCLSLFLIYLLLLYVSGPSCCWYGSGGLEDDLCSAELFYPCVVAVICTPVCSAMDACIMKKVIKCPLRLSLSLSTTKKLFPFSILWTYNSVFCTHPPLSTSGFLSPSTVVNCVVSLSYF